MARGGGIFRPKPPVFDRSWRSPSKNTVKNSTEDTCSWTRPSKIGKRKVKKTRVFQLVDLNFLVCNIFFCGSAGGRARRRIFEFLDPFSDWFSSFCDSRNTGFYSIFLFSACLTASFKTSKNLVNYAVLCYGVNENIVNTSVFWRWLKNTVNYSVFGHLTLKNHGICSGFCFSPRKNTVNNSNFAVFSCFSLFFELRWSAIHGYQILRVFFPTISTFGCFWSQWPTSLAVTSGCPTMRCGRLPSRSDVNTVVLQKGTDTHVQLHQPKKWLEEAEAQVSKIKSKGLDLFLIEYLWISFKGWPTGKKSHLQANHPQIGHDGTNSRSLCQRAQIAKQAVFFWKYICHHLSLQKGYNHICSASPTKKGDFKRPRRTCQK